MGSYIGHGEWSAVLCKDTALLWGKCAGKPHTWETTLENSFKTDDTAARYHAYTSMPTCACIQEMEQLNIGYIALNDHLLSYNAGNCTFIIPACR